MVITITQNTIKSCQFAKHAKSSSVFFFLQNFYVMFKKWVHSKSMSFRFGISLGYLKDFWELIKKNNWQNDFIRFFKSAIKRLEMLWKIHGDQIFALRLSLKQKYLVVIVKLSIRSFQLIKWYSFFSNKRYEYTMNSSVDQMFPKKKYIVIVCIALTTLPLERGFIDIFQKMFRLRECEAEGAVCLPPKRNWSKCLTTSSNEWVFPVDDSKRCCYAIRGNVKRSFLFNDTGR